MTASAITWALQSFVLSKVKLIIGNDADTLALASAIIVSFVGFLSANGPVTFKKSWNYLKSRKKEEPTFSDETEHRCYVPLISPQENGQMSGDYNALYDSVIWYITNYVAITRDMIAFTQEGSLRVLPSVSSKYELDWENKKLTFQLLNEEIDDKSHKRKIGIELRGPQPKKLHSFMEHCRDSHKNARKKEAWRQKLWSHSAYGCDASWTSEFTYNAKTWNSVVLPVKMKNELVHDIETFMDSEKWYADKGVCWNRGILLSGEPGSGKTSLIKAISNVYQMDIYDVKLQLIHNDSELKTLFKRIPTRSVVVMEDIDAMGSVVHRRVEQKASREDDSDDESPIQRSQLTLQSLLNILDGVSGSHGRILIMTTNHKEVLDPALLRPGRCDIQLVLERCTNEQIDEFFKVFTGSGCDHIFPDKVLSAAQVSNVLLTHRLNPSAAIKALEAMSIDAKTTTQYDRCE